MKVCLISVPLMARSGVYRSTYDLVRAARSQGEDWSAIVGVRPTAVGKSITDVPSVEEVQITSHGTALISELRSIIRNSRAAREADVWVTMITQSDIAVHGLAAGERPRWVAFVRGLPWPDRGEQSFLRTCYLRLRETLALRAADEVWATTTVLARQISGARRPEIVPAGIPEGPRIHEKVANEQPLIWAGRFDNDKNPALFIEIADEVGVPGMMYGTGPLEEELKSRSQNVTVEGWKRPEDLWKHGSIFLGTSLREAFGRSAAEAAQAGLPVVISDQYGVAELLFTDPELAKLCVLSLSDPAAWVKSVRMILGDRDLAAQVSNHVHANAQRLTIQASVRTAIDRLNESVPKR